MNEQFQATVARWMWTRISVAAALVLMGVLLWIPTLVSDSSVRLFSFPLWGVALIFFIMFLDAHQRWREVKGRKWIALTPRLVATVHRFGSSADAEEGSTKNPPRSEQSGGPETAAQ